MKQSPDDESSFYVGFQVDTRSYGFHLRSKSTRIVVWSLFGVAVMLMVAMILWQFQPLLREVLLQ